MHASPYRVHNHRPGSTPAFSLIELSIVLVIIGLLVGGILAGRSLIRASEIRGVTTEYERYRTALRAFEDKYFAVPGDMLNATSFWGDNASQCSDAGITDGDPGTCNGNGDGTVTGTGANSTTAEMYQFWNQLALAGMIEGSYTGISAPTNGSVIGLNSPRSKYPKAGWSAFTRNSGHTSFWAGARGNMFHYGAEAGTTLYGKAMPAEDVWKIDTKLDDGISGMGKVVVVWWDDCTDAANNADTDAEYLLSDASIQCAIMFLDVF